MKRGSFAVVFTLKNEQDLISSALDYYFYMGAVRIWCFLDNSTDSTEQIVSCYRNVDHRRSIRPTEIEIQMPWVDSVLPDWESNMDVRKRINCLHAASWASRAGIEWLLAVDPDELVLFGPVDEVPSKGDIESRLTEVPDDVDQLLIRNVEVIPIVDHVDRPFIQCIYFTRRHEWTRLICRAGRSLMRKIGISSAWQDRYENALYNVRFRFQLGRVWRAPDSGRKIYAGHYLGYDNQKTIIRSRVAQHANFDTHEWIPNGGACPHALKSRVSGTLLHYDFYSAANVRDKFAKRTLNVRSNGKLSRNEIARLACEIDEVAFDSFFGNHLVVNNINRLLVTGAAQRIDVIQKVFELICDQDKRAWKDVPFRSE